MNIVPFQAEHIPAAARLFSQNFKELRTAVPDLPDRLQNPKVLEPMLRDLTAGCPALAAVEGDRLAGYLAWYWVENFRSTTRKAAYCPEWGHAAVSEYRVKTYPALYQAAATAWTQAGCQTHAITLLAGQDDLQRYFFWNGFGLAVVDAVRSMQAVPVGRACSLELRRAIPADLPELEKLDSEHWAHYSQPPILMPGQTPAGLRKLAARLENPRQSIWLAVDGSTLAGYMQFEGGSQNAADMVQSPDSVAITGAFVRPAYRGQGAAQSILKAGLGYYAANGYRRCSVDFESFNPQAAAFWPRHFNPVGFSLVRVIERELP